MMTIKKLRLCKNGKHFMFNLAYDGFTMVDMIYRFDTKAILSPMKKRGGKAVLINPSRIPVIRKFIETEIFKCYEQTAKSTT